MKDDMNEEIRREWALFTLFCVTRNCEAEQAHEDVRKLCEAYGTVDAMFAEKYLRLPKSLKADWDRFLADHADVDDVEMELAAIGAATPCPSLPH